MRAAPIVVLLFLVALPACRSDPEPEPPPDRFADVFEDGQPFRDPTGGPLPHVTIRAKVTAVDPALNIVLLSVGADDMVKAGYTFTVYRGDDYVTKVVVDKVERDYCSAWSVRELEKSPPSVGDDATTRP